MSKVKSPIGIVFNETVNEMPDLNDHDNAPSIIA